MNYTSLLPKYKNYILKKHLLLKKNSLLSFKLHKEKKELKKFIKEYISTLVSKNLPSTFTIKSYDTSVHLFYSPTSNVNFLVSKFSLLGKTENNEYFFYGIKPEFILFEGDFKDNLEVFTVIGNISKSININHSKVISKLNNKLKSHRKLVDSLLKSAKVITAKYEDLQAKENKISTKIIYKLLKTDGVKFLPNTYSMFYGKKFENITSLKLKTSNQIEILFSPPTSSIPLNYIVEINNIQDFIQEHLTPYFQHIENINILKELKEYVIELEAPN